MLTFYSHYFLFNLLISIKLKLIANSVVCDTVEFYKNVEKIEEDEECM